MEIYHKHSWKVSTEEAKRIQLELKSHLDFHFKIDPSRNQIIAAADISYNRNDDNLFAVVVLLSYPDLDVIGEYTHRCKAQFPYIPGFLSFREIPPLLEIFNNIQNPPNIILCDGQGIAHPRGFGLASHLGLLLETPAIGCAKSLLVGDYQNLASSKGSTSPLKYQNRTVGMAIRTREGVKPVFVSVGHKIRLQEAVKIVLRCSPKYRIPAPLRISHRKVNDLRKIFGRD
ncbi:MAG: endonuclease V [bacterium]|nr:MAG: endonuclease V [bacterium]